MKYYETHQNVTQSWANAVGKMVPIDLLDAGLPQTFNLWKTQHLGRKIKQSAIKSGVPVSWWRSGLGGRRSLLVGFLCLHTTLWEPSFKCLSPVCTGGVRGNFAGTQSLRLPPLTASLPSSPQFRQRPPLPGKPLGGWERSSGGQRAWKMEMELVVPWPWGGRRREGDLSPGRSGKSYNSFLHLHGFSEHRYNQSLRVVETHKQN